MEKKTTITIYGITTESKKDAIMSILNDELDMSDGSTIKIIIEKERHYSDDLKGQTSTQ